MKDLNFSLPLLIALTKKFSSFFFAVDSEMGMGKIPWQIPFIMFGIYGISSYMSFEIKAILRDFYFEVKHGVFQRAISIDFYPRFFPQQ